MLGEKKKKETFVFVPESFSHKVNFFFWGGVMIIIITLVYLLVGWHCKNRLKRKSWKFAFLNLVVNGNEQCCLETEVTIYGRELWKDPICQLYMLPSATLSLENGSFERLLMQHPGHKMGISQGTPLAVASQRVLLTGSEGLSSATEGLSCRAMPWQTPRLAVVDKLYGELSWAFSCGHPRVLRKDFPGWRSQGAGGIQLLLIEH